MVSLLYAALEETNNFPWRLSFYFFIILFQKSIILFKKVNSTSIIL